MAYNPRASNHNHLETTEEEILRKNLPNYQSSTVLKEIYGVRQSHNETLFEYWERYNELCARLPYNQLTERDIVQYLYSGLLPSVRDSIDAASGGALVDKTTSEARKLVSRMAENSQNFSSRIILCHLVIIFLKNK